MASVVKTLTSAQTLIRFVNLPWSIEVVYPTILRLMRGKNLQSRLSVETHLEVMSVPVQKASRIWEMSVTEQSMKIASMKKPQPRQAVVAKH